MRWELMADHYLKVPNCEWELTETDIQTGRSKRQRFPVPEYLTKGTIVCHENLGQRGDQTFFGDPTPDMVPLDDEAQALTDSFTNHWRYKPEAGEVSASQSIFANMAEAMTRPVEVAGLTELVAGLTAQTKSNQDLVESFKLRIKL